MAAGVLLAALTPSPGLAQQAGDGFAGATVSVRFAGRADAVGAAGLVFQDIVTQSLTATASAGVAFLGSPDMPGALTASVTVGVIFRDETEFVPTWIEYAASPTVIVGFELPVGPPPAIVSFAPRSGVQGTTISDFNLSGTNFDPSSTLAFSGTGVTVASYSSRTATQIVAVLSIAADAEVGLRDMTVLNPGGQQTTVSGGFEVLPAPTLLCNVSTGGTTFAQGAVIPFGAIVFDQSAPGVPLTPSSVGVQLSVLGPDSAPVYGPMAMSFDAGAGQFSRTFNTSGLQLGAYQATFTFTRPDGVVLATRTGSFDLVGSLSLSLTTNKSEYSRGETVGLTGQVRDPSGAPLPGLAVSLRIALSSITREYTVFSNPQGAYAFLFTPPLTEAGTYVATAQAVSGGAGGSASATFVVHGLMLDPASSAVEMAMNSTTVVPLRLRNIGTTNLTDLALTVQDLQPGDGIGAALSITSYPALAAGETQEITLTVTAPSGLAPSVPAGFRLVAVAGDSAITTASVTVSLRNAAGTPVVEPSSAAIGIGSGSSRLLSFAFRNEGATTLTDAYVRLVDPVATSWVVLQNEALGSLAPGEAKTFAVSLLPPTDLGTGSYAVLLEVVAGTTTVPLPIQVEVVSSLLRPVSIQVSDDAGADVGGASVQLVSMTLDGGTAGDQANVYQGTTDDSGRLALPAVAAGMYTLRVQAARHADHQAELRVEAGTSVQEVEAILSTKVVDFSFTVTRTAVTDEYDVALVVTYSTDLIKPALVVSPARIDLSNGEVTGTLTITNSHAQATVRKVYVDTRGVQLLGTVPVRLCPAPAARCPDDAPNDIWIGDLAPGATTARVFTGTLALTPGSEPPSQALGSIQVSGDYDYSLRGRTLVGKTQSQVLVTYTRPDSLRMFPPVSFVNDETKTVPELRYSGSSTLITIENLRQTSINLTEFDGTGPSGGAPVRAIQYQRPGNIAADQVPIADLAPFIASNLWTGALPTSRLEGVGSQTSFDISPMLAVVLAPEMRGRMISAPPVMAVAGRWDGAVQAQGFVFPTSVTTLRTGQVQVVQGGWSPWDGPGSTTILGGTAAPQPFNNHGIVKIQIDQKVSVEREAFKATLGIFPAVASLDSFSATLSIRDAAGNDASEGFVVVAAVPASPIVGASYATWQIIPRVAAGGASPAGVGYTASVHLAYSVSGVGASFDTAPEAFTVLPLPRLTLDYTIPYVVMADILFPLRVQVTNSGGTANSVKIESAQPRIIENVNHLDVKFWIDGASPTGQSEDYQVGLLTLPFGTIASGETSTGYWGMYASRRGFIVDFTSTLTHRTVNGVVLDPIVDVRLHYSPALGGRITAGCALGPLTVSLQGTSASTTPNDQGDYYLTNLPAGSALLAIARGSGTPSTVPVDILADQPTDFVDVGSETLGDLDSDGDQMPDCWELAHQLNPDDPGDAVLDVDSDGLTNLQEYRLGTDPRVAPPDHPPTAMAGGPYTGYVNVPIVLDGSASYDIDQQYGDIITEWDWELDLTSPYSYDDASGSTVQWVWHAPGTYDIGLRVTDRSSQIPGSPQSAIAWTTVTILPVPQESTRKTVTWDYGAGFVGEVVECPPGLCFEAFGLGLTGVQVKAGVEAGENLVFELESLADGALLRCTQDARRDQISGLDIGGLELPLPYGLAASVTASSTEVRTGAGYEASFEFDAPLTNGPQAVAASLLLTSQVAGPALAGAAIAGGRPLLGLFIKALADYLGTSVASPYASSAAATTYGEFQTVAGTVGVAFPPLSFDIYSVAGVHAGYETRSERDLGNNLTTSSLRVAAGGEVTLIPLPGMSMEGEAGFGIGTVRDQAGVLRAVNSEISVDTSSKLPFTENHTFHTLRFDLTPSCGQLLSDLRGNPISEMCAPAPSISLGAARADTFLSGPLNAALRVAGRAGVVDFEKELGHRTLVELSPRLDLTVLGDGFEVGFDASASIGDRYTERTADVVYDAESFRLQNERTYSPLVSPWEGSSGILSFHRRLFSKAFEEIRDEMARILAPVVKKIDQAVDNIRQTLQDGSELVIDGAKWLGSWTQGVTVKVSSWNPKIPFFQDGLAEEYRLASQGLTFNPRIAYLPYKGIVIHELAARAVEASLQPADVMTVIGDIHRIRVLDDNSVALPQFPSGAMRFEKLVTEQLLAEAGLGVGDGARARVYRYERGSDGWTEIQSASSLEGTGWVVTAGIVQPGDYAVGIALAPTDSVGPVVSIRDPADSYTTAEPLITIAGVASDNRGLRGVRWQSDRGTSGPCFGLESWQTAGVPLVEGPNVITLIATDTAGNETRASVMVTRETVPPSISISAPVPGRYGFGSAVPAAYSCTDAVSSITSCTGSVPNGTNIDTGSLGEKTFAVTATDGAGNTATQSVTYTVVPATTLSGVTTSPTTVQYSDTGSFIATLSPPVVLGQVPATSVTFVVGTQVVGTRPLSLVNGVLQATLADVRLREPSPYGTSPTGQMAPGPHTVTAVFGGTNPNFVVINPTTTLTIAKEDARATYTGAVFASTSCATCTTATVTLSATVQDISAVADDSATDALEGDIRNATVTFEFAETGQRITGVPVGLVSAADTKTGTATTNVTVNIGTANALPLTVLATVDGYYTSPADPSVVTVAKPLTSSFITGGGYLIMAQSAGLCAGQAGSKNNFGFNIKYNKSGTNLQGNINTLVRNNGRIYQIKGNAMTSLSTTPTAGKATFNGKANIKDVTDPANPVTVDGNATLQVTMTDAGEPGSKDTLALTVWNKAGGLWFSSSWNGTRTIEQVLGGGNVVVR